MYNRIIDAVSPIELGESDHYTLIVEDKVVAEFHINVLGFRPSKIQLVNASSVLKASMIC